jgi:hypothetical protein
MGSSLDVRLVVDVLSCLGSGISPCFCRGGTGIGLRLVLVIKALFDLGVDGVESLHDLVDLGSDMAKSDIGHVPQARWPEGRATPLGLRAHRVTEGIPYWVDLMESGDNLVERVSSSPSPNSCS